MDSNYFLSFTLKENRYLYQINFDAPSFPTSLLVQGRGNDSKSGGA